MDFQLLFKKAKDLGFKDIEVFQTNTHKLAISVFQGELDKHSMSDSKSFFVKAIYKNDKVTTLSFEDENENTDEILAKLEDNVKVITSTDEEEIFVGSPEYPHFEARETDVDDFSVADKIEMLKKLTEATKNADSKISLVPTAMYNETTNEVRIINSKSLDISKKGSYLYIGAQAVAEENGETKTSFKVRVYQNFKDIDVEKIGYDLAKATVEKLGGHPCDSGKYPVVIANEAMGEILQAFSGMFSGESALKKITLLEGKEGTKVFGDNITIVDRPLEPGCIYSSPFDDEGVACYNKEIVKNGVFQGFLHNLKTAKAFNTQSTGNADKRAGVAPINTYLLPGEVSKDEMIASVETGLYITEVNGLHAGVNPISGDFSVQSSGMMIENGKLTTPVTLVVLAGNFISIMNNVEMIGNDLDLGQTEISTPSLKIKEIQVSGK